VNNKVRHLLNIDLAQSTWLLLLPFLKMGRLWNTVHRSIGYNTEKLLSCDQIRGIQPDDQREFLSRKGQRRAMKTDDVASTTRQPLPKKHRFWYLLAFLLALLGLLSQQPLVLLAALFTLIFGLVPVFWYQHALRHLVIHAAISRQEVLFGDDITISLTIENRKLLPLPWLRVDMALSPPLVILTEPEMQRKTLSQLSETWLLLPFQRVTRRYHLRCHARGSYMLGPATARSSDPFGWLECEVSLPVHLPLVVYPLLLPLETLALASLHPFGEHSTNRPLVEDPLQVIGTRAYQWGDDPRRIHWKATARLGSLQSKVYSYSSLHRVLILLDAWNYTTAWRGTDPEVQELSIAIAASLAMRAIEEGTQVGLLTNSPARSYPMAPSPSFPPVARYNETHSCAAPHLVVPFARGPAHAQRILATLAGLLPYKSSSLAQAIMMHQSLFVPGTTILLVSAVTSLEEETIASLLDFQQRGIPGYLFVTGEGKLPASAGETLPIQHIGGKDMWYELITTTTNDSTRAGHFSKTAVH
jgi:uncharacterized protein (DUF58 family)